MRSSRGAIIAVVLALALSFVGRNAVSEDEPQGEGVKPELITRGYSPWLSPGNKYLAFMRTGVDLKTRDERGQPVRHGVLHLRDLTTSKEAPAAVNGGVTGWSSDQLVILGDGSTLRVSGSGGQPKFPDSPDDLHTPSWTRSPDGKRIAYTVRGRTMRDMSPTNAPKGRQHTIYVVEQGRDPRPLKLGEYVNHDKARGMLAFSPSGRRLAFRLGFMHYGQLPHPRIGVFDLESNTCTWIADEAAGSRNKWADTRPWGPTAWAAWDAKGTRFVFVKTAGANKRDVHTATADGKDVRRLTADGGWKATPCLDPSGERCAYWIRDERPEPENDEEDGPRGLFPDWGESGPHLLRVLMLRTGDVIEVATPSRGSGDDLQWSADGQYLWFGWSGTDGAGVWRVRAPAAPVVKPGTPAINRTTSEEDALLEALSSDDPNEAEAALRRAWRDHDPKITAALIDMLRRWTQGPKSGHLWTLLRALDQRRAVGAIPILLDALSNEGWAGAVTGLLLDWDVPEAVPAWRRLAKVPGHYPKGWSLVALARYGDEADWDRVRERLKEKDPDARDAVAQALAHVRAPQSVEILISLLDDSGFLYTSVDGDTVVADKAAQGLAALSGKKLGRDKAKWVEWWEASGKKLPAREGGTR